MITHPAHAQDAALFLNSDTQLGSRRSRITAANWRFLLALVNYVEVGTYTYIPYFLQFHGPFQASPAALCSTTRTPLVIYILSLALRHSWTWPSDAKSYGYQQPFVPVITSESLHAGSVLP